MNMKNQLIELLNIHGTSGKEKKVRNYLKPILEGLMDSVEVDFYGNLLGVKKVGDGTGATIVLSAHMDTVKGVQADRRLIIKDNVISSNKGALGADDRAGIAIILTVLRNINLTKFNGTIKVAFSREEEIGCVGASKIDKEFYRYSDLAIVVDRSGNRDIVTGCWEAFCSDNVGIFMENVGAMAEMSDWKCVEGGISDATVFSTENVNSINLSCGYYNEHTSLEYVVVSEMYDTYKLIMQALATVNSFYVGFGDVPKQNAWVKEYVSNKASTKGENAYYGYGYGDNYQYGAFSDVFENDIWVEEEDKNGDVFIYEIGADVVIQQNDNEVLLSRETLRNIVKQLNNV